MILCTRRKSDPLNYETIPVQVNQDKDRNQPRKSIVLSDKTRQFLLVGFLNSVFTSSIFTDVNFLLDYQHKQRWNGWQGLKIKLDIPTYKPQYMINLIILWVDLLKNQGTSFYKPNLFFSIQYKHCKRGSVIMVFFAAMIKNQNKTSGNFGRNFAHLRRRRYPSLNTYVFLWIFLEFWSPMAIYNTFICTYITPYNWVCVCYKL